MKIFQDKHGNDIQLGNLVVRRFTHQRREHPGRQKVAYRPHNGEPVIVPDEGRLLEPTNEWQSFKVVWSGACMVLKPVLQSNPSISNPYNDVPMNDRFRSEEYEVFMVEVTTHTRAHMVVEDGKPVWYVRVGGLETPQFPQGLALATTFPTKGEAEGLARCAEEYLTEAFKQPTSELLGEVE